APPPPPQVPPEAQSEQEVESEQVESEQVESEQEAEEPETSRQQAPPQRPQPQPERPPQAAAPEAPAEEAGTAPPDTLQPAPPVASDPVVAPPPPPDPAAAALARIRAAVADAGRLAPRGPLAPWPEALAGVVWSPPRDRAAALDELLAMRRAGVRAVRTGLLADTLLLRAGDLLGLAFYQDLPIANLPAPALLDTLVHAERLLEGALALAARYRSARHFGLALYSDTSDPRARPYFERLTALVHATGPEGSRAYYLTRFPEDDRCDRQVDLVLLDARDGDPEALLARWRRTHETAAGIGAFGAAVRPGREGGWRIPGTLAAQARTLELGLGAMMEGEAPAAFFVYRWRDGRTDAVLDQRAEVQGVGYGLMDEGGRPRPALAVVRGFYTGTQRVFAFDAGTSAPEARTA